MNLSRRQTLSLLAGSALAATLAPLGWQPGALAQEAAGLRAALDALSRGDVAKASALKGGLDRLDAKIVDWALARSGGVNADAITDFAIRNPGWPDPDTQRRRAEEALERENPPAGEVI